MASAHQPTRCWPVTTSTSPAADLQGLCCNQSQPAVPHCGLWLTHFPAGTAGRSLSDLPGTSAARLPVAARRWCAPRVPTKHVVAPFRQLVLRCARPLRLLDPASATMPEAVRPEYALPPN